MNKLVCLLLAVLLSGCMQSIRLNDRAIMEGMAIDRAEDGGYRITMQVAGVGGTGESSEPALTVIEQEGGSLTEALARCSSQQGRQMFLGNCSLLVIGAELAQDGLDYLLEFFNANYRVNPSLTVLLAQGEAAPLLCAQKENPLLSAEGLVDSVNASIKGGYLVRSHLIDLIDAIRGPQGAAVLPLVYLQQPQSAESSTGENAASSENTASSEDASSEQPEPSQQSTQPLRLQYAGLGLLQGDRLQALLSTQDAQGLAWIQNRIEARALEVSEPQFGRVSAVLRPKKLCLEPELTGDLLVLNLHLKVHSTVLETELADGSRMGDAERTYTQRLQERAITKEIESLLADTLKQGYDVFGVSQLIRQRLPDYYRAHRQNWTEALQQMGFAVQVECVIDRSGVDQSIH